MNPALPIPANGVPVDYLSARPGEEHLAAVLEGAPGSFVGAPPLVYMKLRASRLRDRGDVAGLINAGVDVEACRRYLAAHARARRPSPGRGRARGGTADGDRGDASRRPQAGRGGSPSGSARSRAPNPERRTRTPRGS
jgi:hypothetical protein